MDDGLIAVTGAAGFIGRAFCARASARGSIRAFVHSREQAARVPLPSGDVVAMDLGDANMDILTRSLERVTTVIHLAGRAHVGGNRGNWGRTPFKEKWGTSPISPISASLFSAADAAAHRLANEEVTERLARAAIAAGVRRFVFASTVKVNGEASAPGRPLRPDDPVAPQDAYARSKHAAERALSDIAGGTAMTPLTLRLPLVYGAGARGNFRALVDAVAARRWLPFGGIDNRRSLLGIDNLVDALDAAIDAPNVAGGVHFIADSDPVSTPELMRAIAAALGVPARLVPVPVALLRCAGWLIRRQAAIDRLTGSLEVDTGSFAAATGWRPRPFALDAAMLVP